MALINQNASILKVKPRAAATGQGFDKNYADSARSGWGNEKMSNQAIYTLIKHQKEFVDV